ncbi:MAG: PIN domain-containing protein [Thermomicrobiaceae bacterium]
MRFLDTNVFLRYLVADLPRQSPRATELFLAIERGEEQVQTSQVVVLETVFTLQKFYRLPLREVRDLLLPLIQFPGIRLAQKAFLESAFDLAIAKNIDFRDAFNAVFMRSLGLNEIYSWDRHFDRVDGIQRIEPGSAEPPE